MAEIGVSVVENERAEQNEQHRPDTERRDCGRRPPDSGQQHQAVDDKWDRRADDRTHVHGHRPIECRLLTARQSPHPIERHDEVAR